MFLIYLEDWLYLLIEERNALGQYIYHLVTSSLTEARPDMIRSTMELAEIISRSNTAVDQVSAAVSVADINNAIVPLTPPKVMPPFSVVNESKTIEDSSGS